MLYRIAQILIWMLGRLIFRLKIFGSGNIPKTGGVLFAPNHVSYLDIPMLGAVVSRPLHFVGKNSLFSGRFVGWLYRAVYGIPLGQGTSSREGLAEAVRRLKAGHCVVIYPEGGRSRDGTLKKPMPGIGMVAVQSEAIVLPVYVAGTDVALPVGAWCVRPHPISVFIGEPLDFKDRVRRGNGKDLYLEISWAIMEQIAKLEDRSRGLS